MKAIFYPYKAGEIKPPPTNWLEDRIITELTPNKIYDVQLPLKTYDPNTFKEDRKSYYIVKCDDDAYRKIGIHMFKTIDEIRDEKLKELGI
jgi:hypothetical protein